MNERKLARILIQGYVDFHGVPWTVAYLKKEVFKPQFEEGIKASMGHCGFRVPEYLDELRTWVTTNDREKEGAVSVRAPVLPEHGT